MTLPTDGDDPDTGATTAPAAAAIEDAAYRGTVTLDAERDPVRLTLVGDIDVTVKDELYDAVAAATRPGRQVEVDCRGVTFLDSTGVGGLAWLCELTADKPLLIGVPLVTYELLRLTGLDTCFRFAT